MPDLPPTPQPGEVWEADYGERRLIVPRLKTQPASSVRCCDDFGFVHCIERDHWLDWAIRTNARRILEAPKK